MNELTASDRQVLDEETKIASDVSRALAEALTAVSKSRSASSITADLISLRDQVADARLEDVPALMQEMMRLSAVQSVGPAGNKGPPDPNKPYFGHLKLNETVERSNGQKRNLSRHVLVGRRALIDRKNGVVIVDWRDAPVSRLYYRCGEGDDYEVTYGKEQRSGIVEMRRTISFDDGSLKRVRTPERTFVRNDDVGENEASAWVALDADSRTELSGGAGIAERGGDKPSVRQRSPHDASVTFGHDDAARLRSDRHLPEIAALIDGNQFDAMTGPSSGLIILQGGAGSGKTTVALHRIAYLAFREPEVFRPERMLFVVRQPALVKYVSRMLPALDISELKVKSFAAFSIDAARAVVPGRLRKILADAPTSVGQLKKHPGMLEAMSRQLQRRREETVSGLSLSLEGRAGGKELLAELVPKIRNEKRPIEDCFRGALGSAERSRSPRDTKERARRVLVEKRDETRDIIGQWEELVTDRALMAPLLEGPGAMEANLFEDALKWTFEQVDEVGDDGIDPAKKRAVDGGDDEIRIAQRFDPHDCTLLLNLCLMRFGALTSAKRKRPLRYAHIAVDEAQDLSAIEIRPLLACTEPRQSMTLAGDIVQKVVFDNGFDDWGELCQQLNVGARQIEPLRLTYRSTRQITNFAHDALGHLAPERRPDAVRDGKAVDVFHFDEAGEEIAFLAENLRALMARERMASVAVLCRYAERARFFERLLSQADVPRLRLVLADEFTFRPGIDITFTENAKGLEYDYVVIPEMTAEMYPDNDPARHLLHIAATRAAFQLWVTASGTTSPLLAGMDTIQF